jgi:hypothetical protein
VKHNPMRGFEIIIRILMLVVWAAFGVVEVVVRTSRDILNIILNEVLVASMVVLKDLVEGLREEPEHSSLRVGDSKVLDCYVVE